MSTRTATRALALGGLAIAAALVVGSAGLVAFTAGTAAAQPATTRPTAEGPAGDAADAPGERDPAGDDSAGDDSAGDDPAGDDPAGDDPAGDDSGGGGADGPPEGAGALVARAREEAAKGDRGRAIRTLEEGAERFGRRADIHWLLGILYRDTGRLAKAERSFRKATELDPTLAWAWADLAAVLERQGANREALEAANKAVVLDPEDVGMKADRAIIRYRLGQLDEALADAAWAVDRAADDPHLAVDYALMLLTRGTADDRRRALELLTLARAMLPDDNSVALAHAQGLLAAGRSLPAKKAYTALLERNPRQAWANYGRALLAWRTGDFETARKHGERARSVLPHVFTERAHNKRQYFSADAKPFLRWLDGELAPPGTRKESPPTPPLPGPVSIEKVDVIGRCERSRVLSQLQTVASPVASCFGDRAGRLEVRFSISSGHTVATGRVGAGVAEDVDKCVLAIVDQLSFPQDASCRVQAAWSRRLGALEAALPQVLTPDLQAPTLRADPSPP